MHRIPFNRVNWITSSFLIGTALISIIGVPMYLYHYGIDLFQIVMFFVLLSFTMMSITVGYHRLFSHIAFKAKAPVRLFTLIFGACALKTPAWTGLRITAATTNTSTMTMILTIFRKASFGRTSVGFCSN